jgi:hypothetical protein
VLVLSLLLVLTPSLLRLIAWFLLTSRELEVELCVGLDRESWFGLPQCTQERPMRQSFSPSVFYEQVNAVAEMQITLRELSPAIFLCLPITNLLRIYDHDTSMLSTPAKYQCRENHYPLCLPYKPYARSPVFLSVSVCWLNHSFLTACLLSPAL